MTVASLTSVIGYRFYNEPQLDVGTIAPQTITAPRFVKVEDVKSTELKRQEARTGAAPVLMLNEAANQKIYRDLEHALAKGNEFRQRAGIFPFVKTSILSNTTQLYVRQTVETEWQEVLDTIRQPTTANQLLMRSVEPTLNEQLAVRPSLLNASQQQAIAELKAYRQSTTAQDLAILLEKIDKVRWNYLMAVSSLTEASNVEATAFYDLSLFSLSDSTWAQVQTEVTQITRRMVSQGIHPGLPKSLLQQAIQQQIGASIPPSIEPLVRKLLGTVLQPNLVKDPEQTKFLAEQAAQAVEPVMVTAEAGVVIVKAGEKISQPAFVLLDHFGLSRRAINWWALFGFGGLISAAVYIIWRVEHAFQLNLRRRDHWLLFLLTLSTPLLI
ncbi:MAG: hypothetical protein VKJ46_14840, partial [Leptolyngbyaceae bacterium]|nr:hypothetical protein [Leptolyngbyaceae bacterium]